MKFIAVNDKTKFTYVYVYTFDLFVYLRRRDSLNRLIDIKWAINGLTLYI